MARVVAIDETHTRHSAGTLRYMSPEQLNGSLVDHRSDVFGLGCVLYEVLTGRPAFGSTWPEVLARVNAGWVPKPSEVVANLHPSLERMTMRALAIDPGERTRIWRRWPPNWPRCAARSTSRGLRTPAPSPDRS